MAKRLTVILIGFTLLFLLGACGPVQSSNTPTEPTSTNACDYVLDISTRSNPDDAGNVAFTPKITNSHQTKALVVTVRWDYVGSGGLQQYLYPDQVLFPGDVKTFNYFIIRFGDPVKFNKFECRWK